jgi:hypothetical protein
MPAPCPFSGVKQTSSERHSLSPIYEYTPLAGVTLTQGSPWTRFAQWVEDETD